ncbi:MAG: LiaF transmembrane domain-containing protein [Chloroflexota bacterium]
MPLVLIFIGCVFLLQNTDHLPPNAWQTLWRLWPVILVLAGMELLLAHRVPWFVLAAVTTLVLAAGAFASSLNVGPNAATGAAPRSTPTDLAGATQATVTVRFGAGELNIGPLVQPGPDQLAVMKYVGPAELAPEPRYSPTVGGVGRLEYQTTDSRSGSHFMPFVGGRSDTPHMDLNLSPNVPIAALNVQTGATDAHLDLSSLKISSMDISVGAAAALVRLPEAAGITIAHISGGAATITLEVPQGVAAQVRHTGGLSTFEIDQTRFPLASEGVYRSSEYGTAQNKVDLSIETGLTTIAVN